jgi:hypothetical protein
VVENSGRPFPHVGGKHQKFCWPLRSVGILFLFLGRNAKVS